MTPPPDHKHRLPAPWRELWYFASIGSTQRELAALQAAGSPVRGLVLQAEQQTDGHGRREHAWRSEPGGLYISLALPAELTPAAREGTAGWLPLIAALACADALAGQLGLRPELKWPNDVVHEGFKIAGVLGTAITTQEGPLVLLGMGLNWLNAVEGLEREGAPPAAALRDFLPGLELHEREQFITLWLERMTWLYGLLGGAEEGGRERLCKMAEERLFLRGERVLLREPGQPDRRGRLIGLAEDAALRLETADGKIETIYNGSLFTEIH